VPGVSIPGITLQMVIALAWTYRQERTIFAARAAHPAQAAGKVFVPRDAAKKAGQFSKPARD